MPHKIVSSITFEVPKFLLGQNKLWVKRNAEKKNEVWKELNFQSKFGPNEFGF